MNSKKFILFCLISLSFADCFSFTLTRVILSSNYNNKYLQFWPLVSQMWHDVVGIRPTLIFIGNENVKLSTTYGDIFYFKPIPGIKTSEQAQVARLLIPTLYPNDFCIISDIDMMPLSKDYFFDCVAEHSEEAVVVYRKYPESEKERFPMCYIAAKGSVFGEVFNVKTLDDIKARMIEWHAFDYKHETDELMATKILTEWDQAPTRLVKLGHVGKKRVDRSKWKYNKNKLKKGGYIDCHMLRPYALHQYKIDTLVADLGIKQKRKSLFSYK